MSDDDPRPTPPGGAAAPQVAPEVLDGIRSLHERIDELHRLVAGRLESEGVHTASEWLYTRAARVPAWQRRTQGELRWPVAVATAVAIALQMAVPDRLVLVHPSWVLPAVQGTLLVTLVLVNPHRIDRESKALRLLALMLVALLSLANGWSLARLAIGITQGNHGHHAEPPADHRCVRLADQRGRVRPVVLGVRPRRACGPRAEYQAVPGLQFVQMVSPPAMVPPDWEPRFVDYLYLAFTNAAAFSPTDVMPLSRWAKIAMTVQSAISIVTVALVVSRAVNILHLSAGLWPSAFLRGRPSGVTYRSCFSLRHWLEVIHSLTGLSTGRGWPAGSRHGSARPSCGASLPSSSSTPRRTPRCSRSARRRTPAWTSSPTAKSAGRAIPTGSRPPSTGWTSTTRERHSTAAATRTRCPGWSGRSGGVTRSRWRISSSCALTRRGRSRSPCPGRSRWHSRRRTTTTAVARRSPSGTRRR